MKTSLNIILLTALVAGLSACDHHVSMETTVHDNGSLDKTIVLETSDTTKNFLGIGVDNGWNRSTRLMEDSAKEKSDKDRKWNVTYQKTFASAEAVNAEMATPSDTLFRVESKFDKKFRWFYTYIYYEDTYRTINRMDFPPDDFIAPEDYSFIERLPAEGKIISKADSLYLSELHKKIFDIYGSRAIYESNYALNIKLIEENGLEKNWLDTLQKHKENVFAYLVKKQDVEDDFMFTLMDSLGIPLSFEKIRKHYDTLYRLEDAKASFINHASEGKYTHVINMPWTVVRTNADSVSGNRVQWNPPSIKFLLTDYTMYAEGRKLNWWAFVMSGVILIFTGYLFWRKR